VKGLRGEGAKGLRVTIFFTLKPFGSQEEIMLKSYRDLIAWQKAYDLCLKIYTLTNSFPKEEKYCLTSQMRRAAISIPSNIAEGYGRKTLPDYVRLLYIAFGSYCELETQMSVAADLKYLDEADKKSVGQMMIEVGLVLKSLIRALEKKLKGEGLRV